MTPKPPIDGKRRPEREAEDPEAPVIEPDPAAAFEARKPEVEEERDREDKPGVDEYDEERLPPEPSDPSEGS